MADGGKVAWYGTPLIQFPLQALHRQREEIQELGEADEIIRWCELASYR